jgi:chaperone protein EcpD
MKKLTTHLCAVGALALSFAATSALASVTLDSTRVVYPAKDRDVSIKLDNAGEQPVVVQSWLDDGDTAKKPSQVRVPFVLTPPLTRVDPAQGQSLRLVYTGEALPQDRESVYYLNVLEIPPKPQVGGDRGLLQIALRTRIKVFFRPEGLAGAAAAAPGKLTWRLDRSTNVLEARNPTPYYVTMTDLKLKQASGARNLGDDMIAPGTTMQFALDAAPAGKLEVSYTAIDDYGAGQPQQQAVAN